MVHNGTKVNAVFTIGAGKRYANAMLVVAAAILASSTVALPERAGLAAPLVQARATVRIVSGVRLQLGEANRVEGQRLRWTIVSTREGLQPARLVEFE